MAKEKSLLTPAAEAKRWLRKHLVRRRQAIGPKNAQRLSATAVEHFIASQAYRRAKSVALFVSFGSEIQTESIIRDAWKRGKEVLIPITAHGFSKPFFALFRKGDRLAKTSYGPMELVENARRFDFRRVNVVVVPGLAFDGEGFRLGYGGGVYDRLLKMTPKALHIGLYFGQQRVCHLPRESHDRPLGAVVTENGFSISTNLPR